VLTKVGKVCLVAWQVECRSCGRRFVPVLKLLGLAAFKRRKGVAEMASALATEVAYARLARLLPGLAGIDLSARSVRHDTLSLAAGQIGPGDKPRLPVLLLDRLKGPSRSTRTPPNCISRSGWSPGTGRPAGWLSRPTCWVRRWVWGGRRWKSYSGKPITTTVRVNQATSWTAHIAAGALARS
jgi:hypothetical protein